MPVQPTYPGVYIEELPSGVHSITGVATSITAFIGRALSGPTNVATTIESYADFERAFGGLWLESSLGYAVQDFYQNGGSTAVVVRLFNPSLADLQELQAVLNVTDPVNPSTAATLAAAMTQAAQTAQLKVGREEGGKIAAAATAEANRPTTTSVQNAAQAAATAINQAAQAVANAIDSTSPSTPQSLSAAMHAVANTYTTDPAKTAAGLVDSAAATAAGKKGAATTDVQNAATAAASAISTATQAVANVSDTTSPSTPQSLAAAMQTQANTYTTDPAKTAAGLVVSAAQNESNYKATPASVKQAAQQAFNAYTGSTTKSTLSVGGLSFLAYSEGSWGENLRATIDFNIQQDVATAMNLNLTDLFNFTVRNSAAGGLTEVYRNVTLVAKDLSQQPTTRRLDTILSAQSQLVQWNGSSPPSPADIAALQNAIKNLPAPLNQQAINDDVTTAQNQLANATKQLKNDTKAGKPAPVLQADQQAIDAATAALASAKAAMVATDGDPLSEDQFDGPGNDVNKLGLYALEQVDLFNILCIPPYNVADNSVDIDLISEAATYCEMRRAILLVDAPSAWTSKDKAKQGFMDPNDEIGTRSSNAAIFFPWPMRANPLNNNQMEAFAPCGAVAGIFARTDTQRGVWKAPAGIEASLVGVQQLSVPLTNLEQGELNPLGINCLRAFPIYGPVVWGSRTLRGADAFTDQYKYIPVRRLALFLEESLYRGTQWVVFEPNDEPLWAQIRLNVGAFMQDLFRKGAFQGQTPRDAYLVKCDSETTTQYDRDQGIVNILVGFAPLKPAEFVIIQIQQLAGQNQS